MKSKNSKAESATESLFLGTISASSLRNFLPRSISSKHNNKTSFNSRNRTHNAENTPPLNRNIQGDDDDDSSSTTKPILPGLSKSQIPEVAPLDGQKQASATVDLHVKSETDGSDRQGEVLLPLDPSVKVVVRIRPANDVENWGDRAVKKISSRTLSVGDRAFTFDSVFDSKSAQEDVFQMVGVPLVKNALAGYNTSILSYGQSGSGKTYTLWGPPSAMVEDSFPGSCQGIVPRIFQMLFSEIQKEQENSEGKQFNYQFRCSFLEIYNEEIGDLLDPTMRNLEIKDDPKNGLYVENLTEEYVTSYEDVTQILIKGLSSRKVGATSLNSKSSRSHIVCTFIIESWCKETSSKCFGSSKTSRMSFVDLAGLDRNNSEDAGRESSREDKHVKKSLSRLGLLVNTLAKAPQSGKFKDLYKASCLTHLLRESIGGNTKLTVICAISPENTNNGGILRTLRFGERVKSIRNEPVINEITEDDVNDLTDQIRQLKDELIRAKSSGSVGSTNGYFQGQNVRESLNQLRVSLNRSLILPRIDNDSDEDVNVDEDDVRELRLQLDSLQNNCEEDIRDSVQLGESRDTYLTSEDDFHSSDEIEMEDIEDIDLTKSENVLPPEDNFELADSISPNSLSPNTLKNINSEIRSSLSVSLCSRSPIIQDPTLSESPKLGNTQRKSVTFSSSCSVSQKNVPDNSKSDVLRQSLNQSERIRSSLRSSKIFPGPTESLAASLQRGLQIIDNHQQNSASGQSAVSFSFEHLTLKSRPEVANSSAQTLPETRPSVDGLSASFLCASCKRRVCEDDNNDIQDSLKTWTVAVNAAGNSNQDAKDVMEEAAKQEELEIRCMEQAAKIEQLNQLVEQYKSRKNDSSAENAKEIIPYEDSKDGEMLLRCSYVDIHQPEVIKEVEKELDFGYGDSDFDLNEKEALLKEVQMLRSKLQSHTGASSNKSTERLRSSLLSRSIQLPKSGAFGDISEEELERERQRWTEMESDWISLTDDLRVDLQSLRGRAEKVEMELKLEKQCTEELDDALHRSVLGHARMVEHYAELQEKYNDLVGKHRAIMEGIAEVKRAAAKAGAKGRGSRFAKSLATELSVVRVEREREKEHLKKENKSLKIQLRDTAEAVHAAGELLVRLREAEHAASAAEENFMSVHQENEKLKKQMEKLKRKHKMELITMKQYMAESKLPESALQPLYREDSGMPRNTVVDDDQAWRAEFGAIYQDHY